MLRRLVASSATAAGWRHTQVLIVSGWPGWGRPDQSAWSVPTSNRERNQSECSSSRSLWSPAAAVDCGAAAAGWTTPSVTSASPPRSQPSTITARSLASGAAGTPTSGLPEEFDMEVTRENFPAMLPVMERAIEGCDFVGIDLEMSGLFVADSSMHYLDEMEDRYREVAESARRFLPMQLGVSCFTKREGGEEGRGPYYEAQTFCIYLFPLASGDNQPRFESEAKSLAFLASCGFDFNKCFGKGVPFLTVKKRDAKLATVDRHSARTIATNSPSAAEAIGQLVRRVSEWLRGSEPALQLPPFTPHTRALQLQELQKPQFRASDPPGFYIEKTEVDGRPAHRLVRASQREVHAFAEAERQRRVAEIHDLAGASRLLEMIQRSGKPVVGHNPLYDVLFLLEHFAAGLPDDYVGFKKMAREWFPGGIFDTKYIGETLSKITRGDSGLQRLYRTFAGGLTGDIPLLDIRHAPGFSRYEGLQEDDESEAGKFVHEAGFDAFMTGSIFAHCLERLNVPSGDGASGSSSGGAEDGGGGILPLMEPYAGRLHVAFSDHGAMHLWGDDSRPERPHVLYVCNIERGDRKQDVVQACREAGMRNFNVDFLARMQIATVTLNRRNAVDAGWSRGTLEKLQRQACSSGKGWTVKTVTEHRRYMEELQSPRSTKPEAPTEPTWAVPPIRRGSKRAAGGSPVTADDLDGAASSDIAASPSSESPPSSSSSSSSSPSTRTKRPLLVKRPGAATARTAPSFGIDDERHADGGASSVSRLSDGRASG